MKKLLLSAAAMVALLASCKKEETNVTVTPYPYMPPFRVTGINDLSFEKSPFMRTSVQNLYLSVVYGNGVPKRVSLDFSEMPQGIQDSLSVRSGYPDFQSSAQFFFGEVANGNYKVNLTATPDSGTAQTYPINITVKGDTSCVGYLISGSYRANSTCVGSNPYNVTLSKNGLGGDTLFFNNFKNTNVPLMVVVSCNNSSVTIPYQIINGMQYYGTGYSYMSSTHYMSINLTERDLSTGTNSYCTYSYNRN